MKHEPVARVTLLRSATRVASPWKNGGGVTREVAVVPEDASLDAFLWRVSVADVGCGGPFSRFADVDRTLVLLEGAGMLLDEDGGRTHALTRAFDVARFAGDAAVTARLVDGATRDFNVMVRRDAVRAELAIWRDEISYEVEPHATLLLYCAQGAADVSIHGRERHALTAGDALRIDATTPVAMTLDTRDDGVLLAVTFTETPNLNDEGCAAPAPTR